MPGSASVEDYERIQAPVYAFLFTLAQAGSAGGRLAGANPSAKVWQALGGGYGRAAKLRGWLLGTVALPGAVGSPTGSASGRSGPTSPRARSPAPGWRRSAR